MQYGWYGVALTINIEHKNNLIGVDMLDLGTALTTNPANKTRPSIPYFVRYVKYALSILECVVSSPL